MDMIFTRKNIMEDSQDEETNEDQKDKAPSEPIDKHDYYKVDNSILNHKNL